MADAREHDSFGEFVPALRFRKDISQRTEDAREDRREAQIKKTNRARCVLRDGECRLLNAPRAVVGECMGHPEWHHLRKRSLTRNEPPEDRHSTTITIMACTRHHDLLDDGVIKHRYLTKAGADGRMAFWSAGGRYEEDQVPSARRR